MKEKKAFLIEQITFRQKNETKKSYRKTAVYKRLSDFKAIQRLYVRKLATQVVHRTLNEIAFLPTQSPTITGDWVRGNTQPFALIFYDYSAYLSISNSLFHQITASRGFDRIYELGKLHRKETPSTRKKLAEFTILDISQTFVSVAELCSVFEKVITELYNRLVQADLYAINLIEPPIFETISYEELLEKSGIEALKGSQFTSEIRSYLKENYSSFVWITGFNKSTRPFYIKTDENEQCIDCQLWFKGERYFAAGGAIETDLEIIRERMRESGKEEKAYYFYLDFIKAGLPEMCSIGMGFELLLSCLIKDSVAADFTLFPKYKNQLAP